MDEELIQLLATRFRVAPETITEDTDLVADLGADSLALAELVALLEEELGKPVPADQVMEVERVGELAALVTSLRNGR